MAAVGKVSILYEAKALIGEGPFYDQAREELVWVDIEGKSINFLDVNTRSNRSLQLEDKVGAAIPCEDDDNKLVAVIGKSICLVDRASGEIPSIPFAADNVSLSEGQCAKLIMELVFFLLVLTVNLMHTLRCIAAIGIC